MHVQSFCWLTKVYSNEQKLFYNRAGTQNFFLFLKKTSEAVILCRVQIELCNRRHLSDLFLLFSFSNLTCSLVALFIGLQYSRACLGANLWLSTFIYVSFLSYLWLLTKNCDPAFLSVLELLGAKIPSVSE